MSRIRTDTRIPLAVLSVACVLWLVVFASSAQGGTPPTSDSTTTTTEEPTTTTTEPVTTTSPASTTTQPRPSTTSTTVRPSTSTASTSTASTTTSAAPPSSVEEQAPEIVTDDTLPSRVVGPDDGGLSTDTKLAFVVGGLVAVGALIGLLTFLYWRHTRPKRYMDALDALADVEQKVPRSADDVPTAEHLAIPAGVAAGTAGATTAIRILEADHAPSSADVASGDDAAETSTPDAEPPTKASPSESVSFDEPTTITTIEDLKTKGAFEDD